MVDDNRHGKNGFKPKGVPAERAYTHRACGQVTVVSGSDFDRLANPFAVATRTFCVGCQRAVWIGSVAWEDTGESIATYRRRQRQAAPFSLKLFGWGAGPLLGAAVGWAVRPNEISGAVVGAIAGFIAMAFFAAPLVCRWFWKIDYRSMR